MRLRALFAALVAAQIAYSRVPDTRRVAATRGIVGLLLGVSAVDTAAARGGRRAAVLLGAAGGGGFAVELLGVATGRPFGHYTYGGGLGPRVRGVPLLAAAAWAMMARPAWVVAGLVARSPLRRILVASGALAAWDVFLDPRMVREGYWTWPGGGRYEGVPASNFLGWVVTAAGIFAVWWAVDPHDDPAWDGDGALALYLWTWVGETVANAVIWRRPRVAVAGGAAMGAFAVPAVLARRRRRLDLDVAVPAGPPSASSVPFPRPSSPASPSPPASSPASPSPPASSPASPSPPASSPAWPSPPGPPA